MKACTEALNHRIEAKIRGSKMKKYLQAMAVVLVVSAMLTGCNDEAPKKEEGITEDAPQHFNFKPSDRSKNKGF